MASRSKKQRTVLNVAGEDGTVVSDRYTLFYGATPVFSNFHPSKFILDGNQFVNTEQYFHYAKAVHFNDPEIAAKILATDSPRDHKKLGRAVKGYVEEEWTSVCLDRMREGVTAKFEQNEPMRKLLFATAGTTLVEASPRDRKWGIVHNPLALDESNWRGQNLLGKVLTDVRDELMQRSEFRKEVTPAEQQQHQQ